MGPESRKSVFVLVFSTVHSFIVEPVFGLLNVLQNELLLLRVEVVTMGGLVQELSDFVGKGLEVVLGFGSLLDFEGLDLNGFLLLSKFD